jgi:hypothetical protein
MGVVRTLPLRKMFGPKFAGLVALFVSLATAQTTTLEAESATLSGVTVATTVPGYSGECAVMLMLPSC